MEGAESGIPAVTHNKDVKSHYREIADKIVKKLG